jgi:hypothetical protein
VRSGPSAKGFVIEESPDRVGQRANTGRADHQPIHCIPERVGDTGDGMANDSDTASHGIENGVAHRTNGKKIRSTVNHKRHQADVCRHPLLFAMGGGLFWLIHDAKSSLDEKINGDGDRLTKLETFQSRFATHSRLALAN